MRKITTILALLLVAVGVSAQSWTIDVDPSNGTFLRRDGSTATSSQWAGQFVSNISGAPVVTITARVAGTIQHKFATTRDGISTEPNNTVDWTISVEDGYAITEWTLAGAMNGGSCVVTPAGGSGVTFTTSGAECKVPGLATQSTTFTVTDNTSGDKRINFSKFQVKVAKTYEVIVDMSNGNLYRYGSMDNNSWASQWQSNDTDPQVMVTASANNIEPASKLGSSNWPAWADGTELDYRSGTAQNSTYTVSCSDGYIIVSGSFSGAALSSDQTVTVEGNDKVFTTTQETFNFPVDSRAQSFGFKITGPNTGLFGKMKVVMIKPTTVNVQYNVYLDGVLVGTETTASDMGYEPLVPAKYQGKDFVSNFTYDVTEITAATTEVNASANWTGPFEYGSTLATSHWYFLSFRPDASVCYPDYETTGDYNVQAPATRDDSDKFKWAFVGNPFDGFTIYNKAAGDGLVLGSATHDPSVDSGNSTKVTMGAPNSQTEEHWFIQTSSHATNGFFIVNSNNQGLNKRSNAYIAYWTSGKDIGSTFVVTDAENFYNQVMSDIKPVYDNAGKPFYTSLASVAPMQALIEQVVNTSFCSQSDYETLLQYVQEAANSGYIYPETGNYRFKSSGKRSIGESYLSYGVDGYYNQTGLVTVEAAQKETNLSTVFKVTKVGDNQYTLSTQGMDVQTVSSNNTVFPLGEGSATVFSFVVNAPGIVAVRDINNAETTNNCLHEAGWYAPMGVVRWSSTSDCSQWSVEEADVVSVALHTAGDNKAYATFYAPFDATFTNVTAYTITRGAAVTEGHEAVLTEVTGVVPAGTPVVLVDETGTVAAATANVSYGAAALGVENILSGHYLAGTVADGSLVFGQVNSTPGFYQYDKYSTVLAANRAFIAPENASNIRALVFVDPTTGISTTLFNTENGNAYDLQGRRVQNTQKGLYIINGKKVIVQ